MAGKSRRAGLITDCSRARIPLGVVAVSRFGDAGGAGTYLSGPSPGSEPGQNSCTFSFMWSWARWSPSNPGARCCWRSGRNAVRTSVANSSGSSQAAKWPPLSASRMPRCSVRPKGPPRTPWGKRHGGVAIPLSAGRAARTNLRRPWWCCRSRPGQLIRPTVPAVPVPARTGPCRWPCASPCPERRTRSSAARWTSSPAAAGPGAGRVVVCRWTGSSRRRWSWWMSRASGRRRCGRCRRGWGFARCRCTGMCRTVMSCLTRW